MDFEMLAPRLRNAVLAPKGAISGIRLPTAQDYWRRENICISQVVLIPVPVNILISVKEWKQTQHNYKKNKHAAQIYQNSSHARPTVIAQATLQRLLTQHSNINDPRHTSATVLLPELSCPALIQYHSVPSGAQETPSKEYRCSSLCPKFFNLGVVSSTRHLPRF